MKLLAYVQALTLVVRVVDQKLNNLPPYPWVAYPTSSQQNSFRLLKADCNQNKTYRKAP